MKRKLACLLTAVMVSAALAGCGSGNKGDSKTETAAANSTAAQESDADAPAESGTSGGAAEGKLTMWVWTDISAEIEDFKAKNPGVEIDQVVIDSGDYLTKLQTTVASGGELPDLVWGEISNRGQLFSMDILDDLTAAPYNLDTARVQESVLPTMQAEDGRYVGLERNVTPSGLAYHRGLAEQYLGTSDPDEIAAMFPDWDSFIKAGEKVLADSDGAVTMFTSLGDVYYIVNGQMDKPRITGETIHTEALKELFTDICKFRDAGIVGKIDQWSPAWYASFGAEDALFSPMPSFGQDNWLKPNAPDGAGDWALITPPGGGFSWGGTCWSITKDSKNKELAWEFIQYDVFGDGVDIRYANGETPSAADYMTDEKLSEENAYFGGQKVAEIYVNDIVPTIKTQKPSKYDYSDICTIEIVLSSLNTDYSLTPDEAVQIYIDEMCNQSPELKAE